MTRDEILELFARQQKAWEARDPDALAASHAAEGTLVSPIFGTLNGRAAILASYRSLFQVFPDWTYTGADLVVDDSRVAEPFTVTATHVGTFMGLAGTGRRCTIHGIRLFDIRDGAIFYERRYYDFTGLLIQLGILRGKPARPDNIEVTGTSGLRD
jgi:steroid delta-isomerase-like uncharacterized protein